MPHCVPSVEVMRIGVRTLQSTSGGAIPLTTLAEHYEAAAPAVAGGVHVPLPPLSAMSVNFAAAVQTHVVHRTSLLQSFRGQWLHYEYLWKNGRKHNRDNVSVI